MADFILQPWPWYISGVLIGLAVPALLIAGNRGPGVSSSLRDVCSALLPSKYNPFALRGRPERWNILFAAGIFAGGAASVAWLSGDGPVAISESARRSIERLGIKDLTGILPDDLFGPEVFQSAEVILLLAAGGFFVGFGTRIARGCTSGHTITGLSTLQWPSLVATLSFFAGGLFSTHVILPLILG